MDELGLHEERPHILDPLDGVQRHTPGGNETDSRSDIEEFDAHVAGRILIR